MVSPQQLLLFVLATLSSSPLLSMIKAQPHNFNNDGEFNTQVMLRVMERLEDFMTVPVMAAGRAETMRKLGVFFPHELQGQERNTGLSFLFADVPHTLYYGLEDGTFLIISSDGQASYREPGESYRVWVQHDEQQHLTEKEKFANRHFYQQCVDRTTGAPRNCTMTNAGSPYIQCVDDCALKPCSSSKKYYDNCFKLKTGKEKSDCLVSIYENVTYWCPDYTIAYLSEEDADAGSIGYIPRTYSCLNSRAQLEEGRFKRVLHSGTDCYFGDGVTLVNRSHISGEFQYCQTQAQQQPQSDNNTRQSCSGVFTGGFRSRQYDPRFRGWYRLSRESQADSWSSPYPFYTSLDIGITYALPMHKDYITTTPTTGTTTPAKQFYGVWGVDVSLSLITDFLTSQYNNTDMWVLVLDTSPPYNVIASSTGSAAAKRVLASNLSIPCPANDPTFVECTVIRVPIAELSPARGDDTRGDQIVRRSFAAYQEAGFPGMSELIGFKIDDEIGSDAFVAQGEIYEQAGGGNNLQWYVLVSMSMARSSNDAVLSGSSAFATVAALATIGAVGCLLLFLIIYQKRKERAFINGDWRFTSAFILGCSALNISTYTLLGENTNQLCMLRMWAFNLLFAIGKV